MKRYALIAAIVLVLASLFFFDYKSYRGLKHVEDQMTALSSRVNDASRLAQEESSAAAAASQRADQAAAQAELAAGSRHQAEEQRQQAEEQRQQAEAGKSQAQTAAEQASQEARLATQRAQQAQVELDQIRREREAELNRMQDALSRVVQTKRTPQGMTIILPDSTFRFPFDSAELSQKNRELLSRIAGILLVSKGYGLSVFGYTDDVGTAEYNHQLSLRRASAVEQYLIESGIDKATINVKGYGKTSPIVAGTGPTARAKNRRVEIALTDTQIRYGDEAPANNR